MDLNRRRLAAALGFSSAFSIRAAFAADETLATGSLSGNRTAGLFNRLVVPPQLSHLRLIDDKGEHRLAELKGRTWLVPLWADWCAPCLREMPDYQVFSRKKSGPKFGVLPMLTGANVKTYAEAQRVLAKTGVSGFEFWMEPDGGKKLLDKLAILNGAPNMPCAVIINRHGFICARSYGAAPADPESFNHLDRKNGVLTDLGHAQMIEATRHTVWSTPDADAFADALADGAVDHL